MDIERVKRVIHPEGYGFWLGPDGLFTLFGAIIATAALSAAIDVPEVVRKLGDPMSGAPMVASLASTVVYLATARAFASVVQALVPEDFDETGRFHAWIAVFGIVLALGIVVLGNWPLPDYVGSGYASIAVRLAAIVRFLLAGGIPFRRVLEPRNAWIQHKVEELRRDRG